MTDTFFRYPPRENETALPGHRYFFKAGRVNVDQAFGYKGLEKTEIYRQDKLINASSGFGSAGRLRSAADYVIDRAMFDRVRAGVQLASNIPPNGNGMRVVNRVEPAGYAEDTIRPGPINIDDDPILKAKRDYDKKTDMDRKEAALKMQEDLQMRLRMLRGR